MRLFILSEILLFHMSYIYGELNLTRLMSIYINSCGEEELCRYRQVNTKYQRNFLKFRCPPCSCEDGCHLKKTCCPDKFFERNMTRYRYPFFRQPSTVNEGEFPKYPVIDYCPESAEKVGESLCQRPPDKLVDRNFVTSLVTNYTYYNVYCALCNGESRKDTVQWDMSIDGIVNYIYFIKSEDELSKMVQKFNNLVLFIPPERLRSIVSPAYPDESSWEYSTEQCPDEDLQIACSSTYEQRFRTYKNIFCYICKLKRKAKALNLIDSCPTLVTNNIQKLCEHNPVSELTYPYKNYFCFLCSIPENFYSIKETKKNYFLELSNFVQEGETIDGNNGRLLIFHDNTYNDLSLLKKIWNAKTETSGRNSHDMQRKYSRTDFKSLLTKIAAVYPQRICNRDVLPNIIQNSTRKTCVCSHLCLFQDPCTCCMDTSLLFPVKCIRNYIAAFHERKMYPKHKIQVIATCYEELQDRENTVEQIKVMHLCEDNSDDFDFPVVSNNITYKNVFCFLCNTNYTILNLSLVSDPYKILDINIICDSLLQFDFFLRFSEVIAEAIRNHCNIMYDVRDIVLCHEDQPIGTISTCKHADNYVEVDQIENWACANTSWQAFTPAGNYKNEFCQICNAPETFDDMARVDDCDELNVQHMMYKNACLSLPDVRHHPRVNPYRNVFCSYCAKGNITMHLPSSRRCRPVFGTVSPLATNLMRDLFVPIITLKASTFSREHEFAEEYGCFPGRVIVDGVCTLIIPFPKYVTYHLHILCSLNASATTNNAKRVLFNVRSSVLDILRNYSQNSKKVIGSIYFLPEAPLRILSRNGLFIFEMEVCLHYFVSYSDRFDRDAAENELLMTPKILEVEHTIEGPLQISFLLKGKDFCNLSKTLTSPNFILEDDYYSFKEFFQDAIFMRPDSGIIVNRLMTCKHRLINAYDVEFDNSNQRIILKDSKEVFYLGEYVLGFNNRLGVCAEFLSKASIKGTYTETLDTLTTVLNALSIMSLILLFVLYMLIPSLRTLPGMNLMSTTFSLFSMQLTYTISNTLKKATLSCKIAGVVLHYFWLCLCCCLFICCLQMFKIFRSFKSLTAVTYIKSKQQHIAFLRYVSFCYLVPLTVVVLNSGLSFYINGNIGYGKKVCFVEDFIQNLVTFVVPLLLTCIINTVMFILTVLNIKQKKDIKKSGEHHSELVIFLKLFFLTGSVWILQVIDSILHISYFSFIVTILTSSQGFFIFLSFATSQRILKYIKGSRHR